MGVPVPGTMQKIGDTSALVAFTSFHEPWVPFNRIERAAPAASSGGGEASHNIPQGPADSGQPDQSSDSSPNMLDTCDVPPGDLQVPPPKPQADRPNNGSITNLAGGYKIGETVYSLQKFDEVHLGMRGKVTGAGDEPGELAVKFGRSDAAWYTNILPNELIRTVRPTTGNRSERRRCLAHRLLSYEKHYANCENGHPRVL